MPQITQEALYQLLAGKEDRNKPIYVEISQFSEGIDGPAGFFGVETFEVDEDGDLILS